MREFDGLDAAAMENVCPDTVQGWLWYCDEHDTHGNADSQDEADLLGALHVAFNRDIDPCRAIVWYRTKHERTQ